MEYLQITLLIGVIVLSIFYFKHYRTPQEKLLKLKEELIEIEEKEKHCKISLDNVFKSYSSSESQLLSDKYEKLYRDLIKPYSARASNIKKEVDTIEKQIAPK
jgi:hypothetical protein